MKNIFYLFVMVFFVAVHAADASEFRSVRGILTPTTVSKGGLGVSASGYTPMPILKPVSRRLAQDAMRIIMAAWNENHINTVLANDFVDRSLLSDAMQVKTSRDVRLGILAIQDVQTLYQHVVDSPSGKILISRVSIRAKTQITFNDPTNGYQRFEGTNEYIIRIKQHAPMR